MKPIALFLLFTITLISVGQNPIIKNIYTADPAAMVYGDSVYLYTGHDEATPSGTGYVMNDWHVFSTADMVNWHDHGEVLTLASFSWASSNAWAGMTIERDGNFFWYVPVSPKTGGAFAIGVAVSSNPTGPFTDAIGEPLITDGMTTNLTYDIDPAIFIDDDGQAYLYWGNGGVCKVVKLKKNMIEMDGYIKDISPSLFTEAAYMHKRNGVYYLTYAGNWPETIEYATSDNPLGPFSHKGKLNALTSSSTNHQSIIKFKNQWYFIYHTADLEGGGDYRRSVAVEYLFYNEDNTIQEIVQTPFGVASTDSTMNCPPLPITPNVKVNDDSIVSSREITVNEGDSLVFYPETLENGTWLWVLPDGTTTTTQTFSLQNIIHDQAGKYMAIFTNSCGIRSYTSYTLSVDFKMPENIASGKSYVITLVNSDNVITIENNKSTNGANLVLATNENSTSQRFVFTSVGGVYWKIAPESVESRVFDVYNISTEDGANIVIWDYWGGVGQQWQIAELKPDIYCFISRNSGKCIDINSVNSDIRQWSFEGDESQQFRLTEYVKTTSSSTIEDSGIAIYRNPADSGSLVIELIKDEELKQILIYDSRGAAVFNQGNLSGKRFLLDRFLNGGLYLIKTITTGREYMNEIVVK